MNDAYCDANDQGRISAAWAACCWRTEPRARCAMLLGVSCAIGLLVACSRDRGEPPVAPSSLGATVGSTSEDWQPASAVVSADSAEGATDASSHVVLPPPDPRLKEVASSLHQWTGVAVLPGPALYVNFPRWRSSIPLSVAQIGAASELMAFPDSRWNGWKPGDDPKRAFVCVQSVVAGPDGNLWVLDPANPEFQGVVEGGAKLIVFNPKTGAIVRLIEFARPVVERESYLNDVRVLKDQSFAFITDSGVGGLVVVDMLSARSRRVLDESPAARSTGATLKFPFGAWTRDGKRPEIHSDGIALSRDQQWLYFQALTGDTLYRVPVKALTDERLSPTELASRLERVAPSAPVDGIETSPDGTLYLTGLESYSIRRLTSEGRIEEWLRDGRLVWPDSIAFSNEGTLYVTTSQIQHGQQPPGPYRIFAVETR